MPFVCLYFELSRWEVRVSLAKNSILCTETWNKLLGRDALLSELIVTEWYKEGFRNKKTDA
jgi:hypothetical protein